jgi:putative nucleotidyltransferase with HDIG domain
VVDLNRPIMQRLALEAPGTYAHTIAMANLVETACNAIGANGLLGRVGTYYHDIGKLERPLYFVENQPKGRNPHDKLKPSASAAIIRNHVREGLELAGEHKLPKAIRAFITEHHGTGRIAYFYEKAKERGDATSPNAVEYAYPAPVRSPPRRPCACSPTAWRRRRARCTTLRRSASAISSSTSCGSASSRGSSARPH